MNWQMHEVNWKASKRQKILFETAYGPQYPLAVPLFAALSKADEKVQSNGFLIAALLVTWKQGRFYSLWATNKSAGFFW